MEQAVDNDVHPDWNKCSLVESVPGKLSGAPVLKGSRMPVQTILDNYDSSMSPEEVADAWELSVSDVKKVLAFAAQQRARSSG